MEGYPLTMIWLQPSIPVPRLRLSRYTGPFWPPQRDSDRNQAATKTRVDLGLNLKGVEPTDRLEGGVVFSGMCTHKVRLFGANEVDEQVIDWLKQDYELA